MEDFQRFGGWQRIDNGVDWAPSAVPYIIEELIESTEWNRANGGASEWYRMQTVWDHTEAKPKWSYTWRTRNSIGDERVQTDIIGGHYCVVSKHSPFVGPSEPGTVSDPRTGVTTALAPAVDTALSTAIDQAVKMHQVLGKELWTIGWDVMVLDDVPVFIEVRSSTSRRSHARFPVIAGA